MQKTRVFVACLLGTAALVATISSRTHSDPVSPKLGVAAAGQYVVRVVQEGFKDYGAQTMNQIPSVGDAVSYLKNDGTGDRERTVLRRVFFAREDRRYDVTLIVSGPRPVTQP